jgi:hypothetical protein
MLTYAAAGVQGKSTPAAHCRNPEDRKACVGENTFSTVPPRQLGCSTANTRNQDDGRVFFSLCFLEVLRRIAFTVENIHWSVKNIGVVFFFNFLKFKNAQDSFFNFRPEIQFGCAHTNRKRH